MWAVLLVTGCEFKCGSDVGWMCEHDGVCVWLRVIMMVCVAVCWYDAVCCGVCAHDVVYV